jgi:hypothetical protein
MKTYKEEHDCIITYRTVCIEKTDTNEKGESPHYHKCDFVEFLQKEPGNNNLYSKVLISKTAILELSKEIKSTEQNVFHQKFEERHF